MLGGALAALGLWLFLGRPDPGFLGSGRFASPRADMRAAHAGNGAEGTAVADTSPSSVADSADPDGAAATPRRAIPTPSAAADAISAVTRGSASPPASPPAQTLQEADTPRREPAGERAPATAPPRVTPASPDPARPASSTDSTLPPEDAVPATAVEARVAAEVAVTRYVRAIESGDLEALRRAHPGITDREAAAWREVFQNGESFAAVLRIADVAVDGNSSRVDVRGSCHYYDLSLRRFVDVPVTLVMFLAHDGRAWHPVLAADLSRDPGS